MESRIKQLEKQVELHGFFLRILLTAVLLDTAAVLVMWGQKGAPDYDHIAVSMTVFQTLFGVAALYGFWALRGLTREKAEDVATEEVAKIAPPLINREVAQFMRTFGREMPISDADSEAMAKAAGQDGKEDFDG